MGGVPCTTHNDCAFSKHNLYCRAVGGANVTASRCVQCMTEHDCQKGEFCVSAKGVVVDGDGVFIGQCAAKESPLGKRCTPGVTSANVMLGTNNAVFCGHVSSWNADNTPALTGDIAATINGAVVISQALPTSGISAGDTVLTGAIGSGSVTSGNDRARWFLDVVSAGGSSSPASTSTPAPVIVAVFAAVASVAALLL